MQRQRGAEWPVAFGHKPEPGFDLKSPYFLPEAAPFSLPLVGPSTPQGSSLSAADFSLRFYILAEFPRIHLGTLSKPD